MNKKGSLFHISKRDALPLPKALLIRGGILLLALVFCGLITTLLTGQDPIAVYGTILKGAFGTSRKIWVTGQNVAVLLGISLAVTPAFKMRFWNIGAEGQTLIGCLATTTCMILLGWPPTLSSYGRCPKAPVRSASSTRLPRPAGCPASADRHSCSPFWWSHC